MRGSNVGDRNRLDEAESFREPVIACRNPAAGPEATKKRARWLLAPRRLGWLKSETSGAQLLEFALSLPFLVVILVGIIDFGQAYNTKHIMVNAAREAARLTASNPLTDALGNCAAAATPCSIQAAADAAERYLTTNGMSLASCINPASPSPSSSGLTWVWSCGNGVNLTINRGYVSPGGAGGFVVPSVQVSLSYPVNFTFGYVIGLLVPGASGPTGQQTLTVTAVMQILAAG